jgi:hypothetical protein
VAQEDFYLRFGDNLDTWVPSVTRQLAGVRQSVAVTIQALDALAGKKVPEVFTKGVPLPSGGGVVGSPGSGGTGGPDLSALASNAAEYHREMSGFLASLEEAAGLLKGLAATVKKYDEAATAREKAVAQSHNRSEATRRSQHTRYGPEGFPRDTRGRRISDTEAGLVDDRPGRTVHRRGESPRYISSTPTSAVTSAAMERLLQDIVDGVAENVRATKSVESAIKKYGGRRGGGGSGGADDGDEGDDDGDVVATANPRRRARVRTLRNRLNKLKFERRGTAVSERDGIDAEIAKIEQEIASRTARETSAGIGPKRQAKIKELTAEAARLVAQIKDVDPDDPEAFAALDQRIDELEKRINRLTKGRAAVRADNRAAAQAEREARGDQSLSPQQRSNREADLNLPSNEDDFLGRVSSRSRGNRLTKDELLRSMQAFRSEGYDVQGSSRDTKEVLAQRLIAVYKQYEAAGKATLNDLTTGEKTKPDFVDKNVKTLLGDITGVSARLVEASKQLGDVSRADRATGGGGPRAQRGSQGDVYYDPTTGEALGARPGKAFRGGLRPAGSAFVTPTISAEAVNWTLEQLKGRVSTLKEFEAGRAVNIVERKFEKDPTFDPYSQKLDDGIQGKGPEPTANRRALFALRQAFKFYDEFAEEAASQGRLALTDAQRKGIERRRKSREERAERTDTRVSEFQDRRLVQDATREFVAGSQLSVGSDGLKTLVKNLPGLRFGTGDLRNTLVPEPRLGNEGLAQGDLDPVNKAYRRYYKTFTKLNDGTAELAKLMEKAEKETDPEKAADLRDAVDELQENLAGLGARLEAAYSAVKDAYNRTVGVQFPGNVAGIAEQRSLAAAEAKERRKRQQEYNKQANALIAEGTNLENPRKLDFGALRGRANQDNLEKEFEVALGGIPQAFEELKTRLTRFDIEKDNITARSATGEDLGSASLKRGRKYLTVDTDATDPERISQLQRLAIGEALKSGLQAKFVGGATQGLLENGKPVGSYRKDRDGGLIFDPGRANLPEAAKAAKEVLKSVGSLPPIFQSLAKRLDLTPESTVALGPEGIKSEATKRLGETEIERVRRELARAGIRWSKTLNESLDAAKNIDELFENLEKLIKAGTLQITTFDPKNRDKFEQLGPLSEVEKNRAFRGSSVLDAVENSKTPRLRGSFINDEEAREAKRAERSAKAAEAKGKGDGFKDECCERIVKAINSMHDTLKKGVRVTGTSIEAGAVPESKSLADRTRKPKAADAVFSRKDREQFKAAVAQDSSDPLNDLLNASNKVPAAVEMIRRGTLTTTDTLRFFRDELGMSADAAEKFNAAVRQQIGREKLGQGKDRLAQEKKAREDAARAQQESERDGARRTARSQGEVEQTLTRVSKSVRTLIEQYRALVAAGGDVAKIGKLQEQIFKQLNDELEKGGVSSQGQRDLLIQPVLNSANRPDGTPLRVGGEEYGDIKRIVNANAASKQAVDTGRDIGSAMGQGMAAGASTAFELKFFGNHGFWSRMINSTGTFIVRNFSAGLVFGITNAFQDALQQGIETEATFVQVSQALEQTGRNTDGIRASLSGLSMEYGVALRDVYATAAGLAGLFDSSDIGNKELLSLTRIATQLQLISRGALNAQEAMRSLASVTSAYGREAKGNVVGVEFGDIADILTTIQNELGVNIEQSVEGVSRLSGQAKQLGINFANVAAYVAAISKFTGQEGAAAGEQFSRILASLQTGKTQSTLFDAFNKSNLGPDAVILKADLQARNYEGVIDNLLKNYSRLNKAEQDRVAVALGGQRQAAATNALLIEGARVLEITEKAQNSYGAAERRATAISQTLAATIDKVRQGFVNLVKALVEAGILNAFGATLLVVEKALNLVNTGLEKFNELADNVSLIGYIRDWGLALLGFLAIIKVAQVAWSNFTGGLNGVKGAFTALNTLAGVPTAAPRVNAPRTGVTTGYADELELAAQRREGVRAQVRAEQDAERRARRRFRSEGADNLYDRTLRSPATRAGNALADGAQSIRLNSERIRSNAALALATGNLTRAETLATKAKILGAAAATQYGRAQGALGSGLTRLTGSAIAMGAASIAASVGLGFLIQGFSDLAREAEALKDYEDNFRREPKEGEQITDADPSVSIRNLEELKLQAEGWQGFWRAASISTQEIGEAFADIFTTDPDKGFDWDKVISQGKNTLSEQDSQALEQKSKDVAGLFDRSFSGLEQVQASLATANTSIDNKIEEILNNDNLSDVQKLDQIAILEEVRKAATDKAQAITANLVGLQQATLLTEDQINGILTLTQTLGTFTTTANKNAAAYIELYGESFGLDATDPRLQQAIKDLSRGVGPGAGLTPEELADIRRGAYEVVLTSIEGELRTLGSTIDSEKKEQLIAKLNEVNRLIDQEIRNGIQAALSAAQALGERARTKNDLEALADAAYSEIQAILRQRGEGIITPEEAANQIDAVRARVLQQKITSAKRMIAAAQERGDLAEAKRLSNEFIASLATAAVNDGLTSEFIELMNDASRAQIALVRKSILEAIAVAKAYKAMYEARKAAARQFSDAAETYYNGLEGQGGLADFFESSQRALDALETSISASAEDPGFGLNSSSSSKSSAKDIAAARRAARAAAIDPLNELARARAELNSALIEQREAAAEFGKNSVEYWNATAQVIEAQRGVRDALDRIVDANTNLAIAYAEASGDTVKAAQLRLQAARTALERARKRGGRNSAAFKEAKAEEVAAAASLRDAKLQDALDTIDFNREIGNITTGEAIKQLERLLENKNLTEEQRRQLLLQIKGLKDELNAQFEGQWNIGDDIKVTPYEMRRALGIEQARALVNETTTSQFSSTGAAGQTQQVQQVATAIQTLAGAIAAKGDYITNDNSSITLNGTDIGLVRRLINEALGVAATQRSGTSTRKV